MIPILSKVKTALRISHTSLDTDILDTIETAKAEMVRAGINPAKVYDDDNGILSEYETSATVAKTSTFATNPLPCPHKVTAIVKSADATEVTAGSTIIINGTDTDDETMAETLTFSANQATVLTTFRIFKTITSIVFSAQADGTPAFNVGWFDPLVQDAIKTYCKYIYWSDSKTQEGYFAAWQYQLDCLRKSSDYIAEVEEVV